MPSPLTICVYCASSEAVDPAHRRLAADLGRAIGDAGWSLVYGGGSVGLMGEVARAAMVAGAHVTGVIPHRLAERELALHEVSELVTVDTMRERKHLMDERADAFVVLPGGIGTLEELVEILTLKQLGYHSRAVVLCDPGGYWQPLLDQFAAMVDQRFAHGWLGELYRVTRSAEAAIRTIRHYEPPPPQAVTPVADEVVEAVADDAPADAPDDAPAA